MSEELHPVVELLLARMKSHPEEFMDEYLFSELEPVTHYGNGRWEAVLRAVCKNANEAELEAVNEALRPIRLNQAHEHMMDELCNGEERRRKEQEEYERTARTALGAGSMGASLRNALSPAVQQAYDQTQHQQLQAQIEAYRNAFTPNNTGLVATMKKALGI